MKQKCSVNCRIVFLVTFQENHKYILSICQVLCSILGIREIMKGVEGGVGSKEGCGKLLEAQ